MYRVLIADDKKVEREYLKDYLKAHYSEDFQVVKEAQDGKEVLEFVWGQEVDLLLLDIQMPKLDGLEVAAQIRHSNLDIFIVIITAYAEFDYAKQAIKSGVSEYLLKPYLDEEFTETLDQILFELDKRKKIVKPSKVRPLYLDTAYFELKTALNKGLLDDGVVELERKIFRNKPLTHGDYKAVVLFGRVIGKQSTALLNVIFGMFKKKNLYIVGYVDGDELILYLFGDKLIDFQEVNGSIQRAVKFFNDEGEGNILCGISGFYDTVSFFRRAYKEAISYIVDFGTKEVKDSFNKNKADRKEAYNFRKDILMSLMNKDEKKCQELLWLFIGDRAVDPEEKHLLYEQLLYLGHYLIHNIYQVLDKEDEGIAIIKLFMKSMEAVEGVPDNYLAVLESVIKNLLDTFGTMNAYNNIVIVRRAKEYIKKHYQKKVTLQEVAKTTGISYGYLSKCFKQVEGTSFNRYLLEMRIKEAKSLMNKNAYTISEISYKVGIEDPNYFSKCFKKITGMTPKNYMMITIVDKNK